MSEPSQKILSVPTNIITGFLGVGKTTVILNLLKHKPPTQHWAILVNEFGAIGVDGSLFSGQYTQEQGVFIREVPGGCMCCAAGLPMQIALNQLLARAKPQRLLIEPTGLGHPEEVLAVLSSEHYRDILDIRQCITLVDARNLTNEKYTSNETFNQQIQVADTIIGHKEDLYQPEDKARLLAYIQQRKGPNAPLYFAKNGDVPPTLLEGKSSARSHHCEHTHAHATSSESKPSASGVEAPLPASGYMQVNNTGEGYNSVGWRFSPDKVFNRQQIFQLLSGLQVERAKGVFITPEGVFGYNVTADTVTEFELDDCLESRIEVIGAGENLLEELKLLQCLEG